MKTAVMFSGQGAQYPGMMKDLFQKYPKEADVVFGKAEALLKRPVYELSMHGKAEELNETQNTQPCLLCCELAALRIYEKLGLRYDAVLGFSLGEWAALVASEAVSEEQALTAIAKRADAMQRAVPAGQGAMVAILGKSATYVDELCRSVGNITPANYNCPGNITVAGTAEAADVLIQKATNQGVLVKAIPVSVPSHCSLMNPAVQELTPVIDNMDIRDPATIMIMNATGLPTAESDLVKENLLKQLSNPVRFQQSIEYLLDQEFDNFVEIGPGKVLSNMVKRIAKTADKKVNVLQFNSLENVNKILQMQG